MTLPFKKIILKTLENWGVRMYGQRAKDLRPRFKSFGKGSYVQEPVSLIKNPQYVTIGDGVCIEPYVTIEATDFYEVCGQKVTPHLEIGGGTHIRGHVTFYCSNHIVIGKNVLIGRYAAFSDLSHQYEDMEKPIKIQPITEGGRIVVKDDAFIGHGAIILPNVTIGKHAVVGAGAVVSSDVPDYSVAAGNPARIIKKYNVETKRWEKITPGVFEKVERLWRH